MSISNFYMRDEQKLSYYLNQSKLLKLGKNEKKIKISILSSFTINGLEETLRVKCSDVNIDAQTYLAGYNQINQQILDPKSNLYSFSPDLTFLIIDVRTIFENLFYFPYELNIEGRKEFVKNKFLEITNLIKTFCNNSNSKLIVCNFNISNFSPYGIFETKVNYGFKDMIYDLNSQLNQFIKNNNSLYVYDFNGFVNQFGENNVFNYREFFFGDVKISIHVIPFLAHDFMGYIKALLGLSRKCIVLDLDNTLWGGIIGEDGFEKIKLGERGTGKAFYEFQKLLLSFHKRGIILAINSKNNLDDAMQVINTHPYMILREKNFANFHINWSDKVSNMKEIAKELNIGLDSMVYFDDDPVNREFVMQNLPSVLTVDLPKDPTEFSKILMQINDFNLLKITDDDILRGTMYYNEKQRKELQNTTSTLDDFLKQLNIKIEILKPDKYTMPRISQLTLKTNQFNLTTKRYQEEQIKEFAQNGKFLVGCAKVVDKFGDNGITGVFIIFKENEKIWIIDTFLLSCRVMGRNIEDAILSYILQKAKDSGVIKVIGKFIATNKNIPSENFLKEYGFNKDGDEWIFNFQKPIKIFTYLELIINE